MRRLFSATVITSLLLFIATSALAQDDRVGELESQAAEAYAAGDYKTAIRLMIKVNQLRPHPNYLLNIAVSYSKTGDCDNARLWAQNALDSTEPSLPDVARNTAQSVIDGCDSNASEGGTGVVAGGTTGGTDTAGTGEGTGAGTNGESDGGTTGQVGNEGDNGTGKGNDVGGGGPAPPVDDTPGRTWKFWTGYALVGVGGLVLAVNLLRDLQLGSDIDDFESNPPSGDRFNTEQADIEDRQSQVTGGYILGTLALVGGGVLLYFEYTDDSTETNTPTSLRMGPSMSPDGTGIGATLQATW